MCEIESQLKNIKEQLPQGVTLVAVSKTKPNTILQQAYAAGQRVFGENRVQELVPKSEALPADIQWHFIGHLQRNKVKYIAPFVHCIQSVDSVKLLREINKEAAKHNRTIEVLLQFHIAQEQSKYGLRLEEADVFLQSEQHLQLNHVKITGVMGMATFTDNELQVRSEFKRLKLIFDQLKTKHFSSAPFFKEISMGMSGDYQIAIQEGSTMVRVGSSIFGSR